MIHLLISLVLGIRYEVIIQIDPQYNSSKPHTYYHAWKYAPAEVILKEIEGIKYILNHRPLDARWLYGKAYH
jgi:hypothetical protein